MRRHQITFTESDLDGMDPVAKSAILGMAIAQERQLAAERGTDQSYGLKVTSRITEADAKKTAIPMTEDGVVSVDLLEPDNPLRQNPR